MEEYLFFENENIEFHSEPCEWAEGMTYYQVSIRVKEDTENAPYATMMKELGYDCWGRWEYEDGWWDVWYKVVPRGAWNLPYKTEK